MNKLLAAFFLMAGVASAQEVTYPYVASSSSGSGAQTNVFNTFTTNQSINSPNNPALRVVGKDGYSLMVSNSATSGGSGGIHIAGPANTGYFLELVGTDQAGTGGVPRAEFQFSPTELDVNSNYISQVHEIRYLDGTTQNSANVANDSIGPEQTTAQMQYVTNGPSFSCQIPAQTGVWFKVGAQTASSVTKLTTFMVWYNVGSGPPHRILFQAGYSAVGNATPRLSVLRNDSADSTNGFGAVGGDGSGNVYVQITNMSHAAIGTITMDVAGWSDDTPDERPTLSAMTTNSIADVTASTILYMTPGSAQIRYPRAYFDTAYIGELTTASNTITIGDGTNAVSLSSNGGRLNVGGSVGINPSGATDGLSANGNIVASNGSVSASASVVIGTNILTVSGGALYVNGGVIGGSGPTTPFKEVAGSISTTNGSLVTIASGTGNFGAGFDITMAAGAAYSALFGYGTKILAGNTGGGAFGFGNENLFYGPTYGTFLAGYANIATGTTFGSAAFGDGGVLQHNGNFLFSDWGGQFPRTAKFTTTSSNQANFRVAGGFFITPNSQGGTNMWGVRGIRFITNSTPSTIIAPWEGALVVDKGSNIAWVAYQGGVATNWHMLQGGAATTLGTVAP